MTTHPLDAERIKPCPFCGGPADVFILNDDRRGVQCEHCAARACESLTRAEAIAAWNCRASAKATEPVAYMMKDGIPYNSVRFPKAWRDDPTRHGMTPLYASPAEPLTPDQWCALIGKELGPDSAAECYRCGALSDVLCRILQLLGHKAVVVTGTCNGVGHCWVECNGVRLDPTAEQFTAPLVYVEKTRGPEHSDLLCLPAEPLEVDDAMVDRAMRAYFEDQRTPGIGLVPDPYDNMRAAIKAALTGTARSALKPTAAPVVDEQP